MNDRRASSAGDPTLHRRSFIRLTVTGGLLSATLPLLSACQSLVPSSVGPTTGATSTSTSKVTTSSGGLYPTYVRAPNQPKPDFPSQGPLYDDGYINYPASNTSALSGDPPGAGGDIVAFVNPPTPPFTPHDQNPVWQEINKRLNVNFQFNVVPQADYQAKMGTLMAGSDLPDLIATIPGVNGVANLAGFLEKSCADLTPYLAGDAAKAYPYLAAIPTNSWKNSGCAVRGRLYMIPLHRSAPGYVLLTNTTIYNQEIGENYTPTSADDFKRVAQQLTRPQDGRYALGSYQGQALFADYYSQMFGGPNNWSLDGAGKLTKNYETPEYKETVGYLRDLWAAGVFHPDIPTITSLSQSYNWWAPGKWVLQWSLWGNQWTNMWRLGLAAQPQFRALPIAPFPAHAGGKPVHFLSGGYLDTTVLKKAAPDRIQELLRVLNWLAAPFGSEEDRLLSFGLEGADYSLDANRNPVLTDRGLRDSFDVPFHFVAQRPQVLYQPDVPDYVQITSNFERVLLPISVSDPTFGLYSQTGNTKGVPVDLAFKDAITEIMVGRRPMSDYDQLVKDWQAGAGDQVRQELQQALQESAV
jgi:putative aldouronate transport system substrate-binding protein